jgi:hypothetical protein
MPSLDDVYCKFGFVAEAAQLIETELGTALLFYDIVDAELISHETLKVTDRVAAQEIAARIDRQTFGQLLKNNKKYRGELDALEPLLSDALDARNRLSHHFYREHNLRRNTDAGREIMMADLEAMHTVLLAAYKALMLLSGTDLDKMAAERKAKIDAGEIVPEIDETKVFHLPI